MYRVFFSTLLVVFVGLVGEQSLFGQKVDTEVVAFYNLENLFDTIDSEGVSDFEFTPEGKKKWNSKKYDTKIKHLAKVIADLGTEYNPKGAAIFGVAEVENISVLNDLVNADAVKDRGYEIIHFDSPDIRGIDVALLYRSDVFKVEESYIAPLEIYDENGEQVPTRDQLVVSGFLNGEKVYFIVNHWPSRYNGEESSRVRFKKR